MSARLGLRTALMLSAAIGAAGAAHAQSGSFIVDMPAVRNMSPVQMAPIAKPSRASGAQAALQNPVNVKALPGDRPDESALRYYASLNQTARVNTEIERLVRLYPGWTPPLDLFNVELSTPEEDTYWELYAAERYTELRAAIEARKKEEPGWMPSKDLGSKLRRKELRIRIMAFWKEGRWQDLVDFVRGADYTAEPTDDVDVEIMWTIAEAYAKAKQNNDALGVYRTILNSSNDQPARLATIQKAMANLRMNDVETLIAMARTDSSGRSEFAPILIDIVRSRISAYLHDERAELVAVPELAAFQDYAKSVEEPNQPGLVAWYYYKTKSFRDALDWFKLALERGGDAMIAHGLAHSLRELDMRRETEEVAFAWREPLVNNLILFIDILERDLTQENPPFIEPERLARYARVTMDVASGEGAQALGWYAYNSCQYDVALEWFQRANAWFPKEATAYGLAITYRKLKREREYFDVVNRYDGLFPKVVELVWPDGMYHPPTPCEELANARLRPVQQQNAGFVVPGSSPLMNPYNQNAPQYAGQAPMPGVRVAVPSANAQIIGMPMQQQNLLPRVNPKDFPIQVNPENMLRFAAGLGAQPRAATLAMAPAAETPLSPEPFQSVRPLVANRVSGVGRMPYERYGFVLLPGWNGVTTPSSPTHAEKPVPAGTLWNIEISEKDRPKGSTPVLSAPLAAANAGMPNGLAANAPLANSVAPVSAASAITAPAAAAPVAPALQAAAPMPARINAPPLVAPAGGSLVAQPVLPDTVDPTVMAQRVQQFFNDKNYAAALDALDKRVPMAIETRELRMIRGWCLLQMQRVDEARQVFATLGQSPPGATLAGGR